MPVVVDAGLLATDAVTFIAALEGALGTPGVLRVDGPWPMRPGPGVLDALRAVPLLTVGVGSPDSHVGAALDVAAPDRASAARLEAAVTRAPHAAVSAALLLRMPPRGVWPGLVAESTTYSMLQAGPELRAWLAGRDRRGVPDAGSPRVRVERHGRVTTIVLTRPARHNALDIRMREELHAALLGARAGSGPVVLRGEGRSFCSGGDLDEFGTFPDPAAAHLVRLGRSLAALVASMHDRLVVGLHGACLGAGIELAAFCERVVAADDARIGLPELGLGLVPGAGGTVSIRARVGRHRLLELLLTGDTIPAATARDWGLVREVVPPDRLEARLLELTESMP